MPELTQPHNHRLGSKKVGIKAVTATHGPCWHTPCCVDALTVCTLNALSLINGSGMKPTCTPALHSIGCNLRIAQRYGAVGKTEKHTIVATSAQHPVAFECGHCEATPGHLPQHTRVSSAVTVTAATYQSVLDGCTQRNHCCQ